MSTKNVVAGTLGVVTFVGVVVAGPIAWWAGAYATAPIRGAVAVSNQNQDGTNRIAATEIWTKSYKDVLRDSANLQAVRQQYAGNDPQGFIISAQNACRDSVTTFNENKTNLTIKDWQPAGIPESADPDICK